MKRPDPRRLALGLIAALAVVLPVATLRRVPTPFADVQLYASIARARYVYGVGVPTITWNSPTAVDHIPFYGPVFFDLAAAFQHLFGVGLLSFRLVSLLGTGLFVLGGVLLAREFSGSRNGPLLAAVLLLVSPEVNFGAGNGAMHMLAVGLEVLALAVFVTNFDRRRSGVWRGGVAGALLGLAALTTPRSYPFLFAFVCAGFIPALFATGARAIRYRLSAALLMLGLVVIVWATLSHGSPAAWVRYLAYIFTHEDTDVAILPTAVRAFDFHWSAIVTLAAVIVGSVVAARTVGVPDSGPKEGRRAALTFLLACTWIQLVTTVVVLNYTFTIGEYILLPALAVLVSWPRDRLGLPRPIMAAAVAVLLLADGALLTRRYVYIAVAWSSLGPDGINAFVSEQVPAGSTVVGPEAPYFFPVEKAGSRYRTVARRSWADWARWVPEIEPEALLVPRRFPVEPAGQRFFIWPRAVDLPEGYECVNGHLRAVYLRPHVSPTAPGWVQRVEKLTPGYPTSLLFELPEGCPTGYDPTRPPPRTPQRLPHSASVP